MGYQGWVMGYGLGLSGMGYGVWVIRDGLWGVGYQGWVMGCGLSAVGYGLCFISRGLLGLIGCS